MDNVDKVNVTFAKILIYSDIIRQFKEDISEVAIYNSISRNFGRSYCDIYIKINLKESSDKFSLLYETIRAKVPYDGKEHFSFYLGGVKYINDNNPELYNEVEHVHYNYISCLLEWLLFGDKVSVKVDRFFTEMDLLNERKSIDRKNDKI